MPSAARLIVILTAIYWWVVFLAMHVLEPQFNPLKDPGSAYVVGAYGALMTTTYFALSAALLAAGIGLATRLPGGGSTRTALALFLVAGAGALIAGIFPMDYPPPARTSTGRLHVLGGLLTFPAWVLGTLLFSLSIRRDSRWTKRSHVLTALSASSIAMLVVMIVSVRLLGFAGLAQRLLLALLFAWMVVVAICGPIGAARLRSAAKKCVK